MKKLILLFTLILLVVPFNVNASVEVFSRNENNNYGVNKHWTINDDNLDNVLETPFVDESQKIYDFSSILTDEEKSFLLGKINQFIEKTNMDMVIVTYNLPYISDYTNEEFAADFYDYNDFGIAFENYSGVVLFRNTYVADRYYDIYTFGNAQLYFSYNRLNSTLDNIYYDFVNDNYLSGMSRFIDDMSRYYDLGIPNDLDNYYIDENGFLVRKYSPPILVALVISTVITVGVITILVGKNKMIKKASKADEYLINSSVKYNIREDIYKYSRTSSYRVSSSSGGSGGGGGSSRGSSGGGHSSGGGRHG